MTSELSRPAHPAIVLAAYLEPLVAGRRVAVLGDATSGLPDELAERGARLVHVADPSPARTAEALARAGGETRPALSFTVLSQDLGVRDGAFDVVIVPDLSLFEDAADLLRRAKKLVGSGIAVVVTPNPTADLRLFGGVEPVRQGLGYYELFDAVSLQFPRVKMAGQAPFVGYTVADFAPDGDPDVSVDTSLLETSEEPELFIAIASEREVSIDAYSVIGMPFESLVDELEARDPTTLRGGARLAVTEAETRLALATAELETLRDRVREQTRETETRASSTAALSVKVVELEGELETRAVRLKETEGRAGDAHVRAERLSHQIKTLEEDLKKQRDRNGQLAKHLDDEKKTRHKAEVELGLLRNNPQIQGGRDRIDALVTELEGARSRIADLEQQDAATKRRAQPSPEAEAEKVEAQRAIVALKLARDVATARCDELLAAIEVERKKSADVRAERDRLSQAAEGSARRLEALEREVRSGDDTSKTADVDALERALAERGERVRELERNVRETERIGRELLTELEEVRSAAPGESAAVASAAKVDEHGELRHRLDVLSATAARSEADLQAASWKVAQLERELGEVRTGPRDPNVVHAELEQALVAAREEVAALRRAAAAGPTASAVEQSVLANQVARELSNR